MTKNQVIEMTGQNVYQIWLSIAMSRFDHLDPEHSFKLGELFVHELLQQDPELE